MVSYKDQKDLILVEIITEEQSKRDKELAEIMNLIRIGKEELDKLLQNIKSNNEKKN